MRRLLLIALLIIMLAGCAPAPNNPTGSKTTSAANNRYLVYTRSGGIAGKTNTWTIYADGRIQADNATKYQATTEETSALLNQIPLQAFIEQSQAPLDQVCPDCITASLLYNDGIQTYKLSLVLEKLDPASPLRAWVDQIDAFLAKASR
jgi:hypothetical protein